MASSTSASTAVSACGCRACWGWGRHVGCCVALLITSSIFPKTVPPRTSENRLPLDVRRRGVDIRGDGVYVYGCVWLGRRRYQSVQKPL
jgi:hypothetical protein